jgi:hypothetical protein
MLARRRLIQLGLYAFRGRRNTYYLDMVEAEDTAHYSDLFRLYPQAFDYGITTPDTIPLLQEASRTITVDSSHTTPRVFYATLCLHSQCA